MYPKRSQGSFPTPRIILLHPHVFLVPPRSSLGPLQLQHFLFAAADRSAADVDADLALLSSPRSASRAFVAASNVRAPRRPLPPDWIGKGELGRHPQHGARFSRGLLDFF